mgnify:CR=1 FL=1
MLASEFPGLAPLSSAQRTGGRLQNAQGPVLDGKQEETHRLLVRPRLVLSNRPRI